MFKKKAGRAGLSIMSCKKSVCLVVQILQYKTVRESLQTKEPDIFFRSWKQTKVDIHSSDRHHHVKAELSNRACDTAAKATVQGDICQGCS